MRKGYPPVPFPTVKPMPAPPADYLKQFSYGKALDKGTLFKWLYDPYHKRYEPEYGFYPPY